ncbi:type VII secretion protein EccB [Streptomyces hyaluromycini]|uniref:type VII secretion protein EccB n=1 Tax=Streptomyces hyaluromycini TaxID=1377993 RepID=UPI000B5C709B|nr:type VII secretion protein EccB [Streptomyces hyaluromycini]
MQTRRDHVQAYQFAMGRLASALVSGDPGRGDSPTRRSALGSVFGVGMAVLLCAGFGVYGLISPAAKEDWRKDGAIVLEEDTGNRYVYANGELRPVRNYASALLIAGERTAPETASAKSLAGVPHGTPVGIQGAPDTVPTASALATGAWARCLPGQGAQGAKEAAGHGQALLFGGSAAALVALPADRQVLLTGPGDTRYLLLRGVKYPVPGDSTLIALGLDDQAALPATADWLAAVPTGAALAAPVPAGAGKAAGQVAGQTSKVGQLFRTSTDGTGNTGGTVHYYVMRSDGLARVNATEYALLAARPGAPAPRQVGQSDIAVAPVSADDATTGRVPDLSGVRALAGGTVCLTEASDGRARITVGTPGAGGIVLPAGGGVLAVPDGSPAGDRTEYLITEQGLKYRIADTDAERALGFGDGKRRLTLPAGVLALVPDGPALSRAAAAKG